MAKRIKHEFNGQMLSLNQIARMTGCPPETLRCRIKRGMSIKEAVNEPRTAVIHGEVEVIGRVHLTKNMLKRMIKKGDVIVDEQDVTKDLGGGKQKRYYMVVQKFANHVSCISLNGYEYRKSFGYFDAVRKKGEGICF